MRPPPTTNVPTITNHEQYTTQVNEVINQSQVSYPSLWTLIQKAQLEQVLYQICRDAPAFSDAWQKIWISLGQKISPTQESFYRQSKINGFELVVGAVYYIESKKCNLPAQAAEYIRVARAHHSIHAEQHYISTLFEQINSIDRRGMGTLFSPVDQLSESEKNLKAAIESVKSYLPLYGSYAYMMLADLYIAYAQFSIDHSTFLVEKAPKLCLEVAKKCCGDADQWLNDSQEAIFNASGGKGLATSTRFGISTPADFLPLILSVKEKFLVEAERQTLC
jgi:hypothetical protein